MFVIIRNEGIDSLGLKKASCSRIPISLSIRCIVYMEGRYLD